ncbi:MAG: hypothetical protein VKK59_06705, partial [Vampirovibrionales bacterium]|nr:hypothetical protein [Vampirovibrionales bacterium]
LYGATRLKHKLGRHVLGLIPFWHSFMQSVQLTVRLQVLYYPLMLFLLLLFVFLPSSESGLSMPVAPAIFEPRWLLLFLILGLLHIAFMAGWFAMMAHTVRIKASITQPNSPISATAKEDEASLATMLKRSLGLQILATFIPGVGRFFAPFLLGTVLQLTAVLLIIVLADQSMAALGGIPQKVIETVSSLKQTATTPEMQKTLMVMLSSLTPLEHAHLTQSLLMIMAAFGLIAFGYIAFTLWMPLVVSAEIPVWRSFFKSLKLFLAYPLGVLLLSALPLFGIMTSQVFSWSENPILAIIALFILLLWQVVSALTPFMFLSKVCPWLLESDSTNKLAALNLRG